MGYFISNQQANKALDPNIHVIDGIYNIKGRSTLHILVASYTKKHVTFNKGQWIGHIEPSIDYMPHTSVNSFTTQKMTDEHVQPYTFLPPLHTLPGNGRKVTKSIAGVFKSQFAQDETSIGTIYLTKMHTDTGDSEPVL